MNVKTVETARIKQNVQKQRVTGHLGPSKIMIDAGLKPGTDFEVLTLGDNFLPAFKNKDTAALGCNVTDYEDLIEQLGMKKEQLRILKEGPALPNDIFVLNNKFSNEVASQIRDKMKANESALISAIFKGEGNKKYKGSELIPADDKQYDYVRGMYEAIGVNDFSNFVGD